MLLMAVASNSISLEWTMANVFNMTYNIVKHPPMLESNKKAQHQSTHLANQ